MSRVSYYTEKLNSNVNQGWNFKAAAKAKEQEQRKKTVTYKQKLKLNPSSNKVDGAVGSRLDEGTIYN